MKLKNKLFTIGFVGLSFLSIGCQKNQSQSQKYLGDVLNSSRELKKTKQKDYLSEIFGINTSRENKSRITIINKDFDGDGDIDFIVKKYKHNKERIYLFENDGENNFRLKIPTHY